MTKRSSAKTAREAAQLAQQLMLTPMVMAMRMPILAAEAGSSVLAGRPESLAAVSEKMAAVAEGAMAAQLAFLRGAAMLPMSMFRATSHAGPLVDLAGEVAVAALKPAARQVSRNHKRLSSTRKG